MTWLDIPRVQATVTIGHPIFEVAPVKQQRTVPSIQPQTPRFPVASVALKLSFISTSCIIARYMAYVNHNEIPRKDLRKNRAILWTCYALQMIYCSGIFIC